MNSFVLIVALVLGADEIDNLIVDLNNDDFSVRIEASKKLMDIGPSAVKRLKELKTDNLETKQAVNHTIRNYYKPSKENISIWFLPNKNRYSGDVDIGKKYYAKAMESQKKELNHFYDKDVECKATEILIIDMIDSGKRQEAIKMLNQMENEELYFHTIKYRYYSYKMWTWYVMRSAYGLSLDEPPETIDKIISKFMSDPEIVRLW